MRTLSIILFLIGFFIFAMAIGELKGREKLIKELETKPYIQTDTHYLMCISKPSKDIIIYRKKS